MTWTETQQEVEEEGHAVFYVTKIRDFLKKLGPLVYSSDEDDWLRARNMIRVAGYHVGDDVTETKHFYHNMRRAVYLGRSGGIA